MTTYSTDRSASLRGGPSPSVRTLTLGDLPAAVALLADSVGEIPLYAWLLGDYVDDRERCEWLAKLLVRPLIRVGHVNGAEIDGRLVGVLGWQPHDLDLSPDGEPPLTPADVDIAVRTPGLRERLLELWTQPPLPSPADDAVNCVFVAVTSELRGGRAVLDLMRPVEDFCRERRRPFYAWTGSAALRDWFLAGWDTRDIGTVEFNGTTMYGVISRVVR